MNNHFSNLCQYCEHWCPSCGLDDKSTYWCNHPDGQKDIADMERCPIPELERAIESIQRHYLRLLEMPRGDSRRRGSNTAILMTVMMYWDDMRPILKGFKLLEIDKWQILLEARDKEIAGLKADNAKLRDVSLEVCEDACQSCRACNSGMDGDCDECAIQELKTLAGEGDE